VLDFTYPTEVFTFCNISEMAYITTAIAQGTSDSYHVETYTDLRYRQGIVLRRVSLNGPLFQFLLWVRDIHVYMSGTDQGWTM